jgi:hypothetical protein
MLTRKGGAEQSHLVVRNQASSRSGDFSRNTGVTWWIRDAVSSGAWDNVDIFHAPTVAAALLIVHRLKSCTGHHIEIWPVEGALEINDLATEALEVCEEPRFLKWSASSAILTRWVLYFENLFGRRAGLRTAVPHTI